MILLIDICELNWVPIFLSWLMPFLLGIGLGKLIWGPYKIRSFDQGKELLKYKGRVNELNADYQNCQKARTQLEGEAAVLRGRIKELEVDERGMTNSGSLADKTAINEKPGQEAPEKGDGSDEQYAEVEFGAVAETNLQVIEGIGPKLESVLRSSGVNSWKDIAAKTPEDLHNMLIAIDPKYRIINTGTWPVQAEMASQRNWQQLIEFQRSIPFESDGNDQHNTKVEKIMVDAGIMKQYANDDLKAIEGIGPKIEALLQDNGIDSWKSLAEVQVDKLQEILDSAGDRFKLANPMTWPTQARLAYLGEWDQLKKLQDKLIRGI